MQEDIAAFLDHEFLINSSQVEDIHLGSSFSCLFDYVQNRDISYHWPFVFQASDNMYNLLEDSLNVGLFFQIILQNFALKSHINDIQVKDLQGTVLFLNEFVDSNI